MNRSDCVNSMSLSDALCPLPFDDVPFEESVWNKLGELVAQVHKPKAELMRIRYEEVRITCRDHKQAIYQALQQYALQREEDLQYNSNIERQRLEIIENIHDAYERWRPRLEAVFEEKGRATEEAFVALARIGIRPRIGWVSGAMHETVLFDENSRFHDAPSGSDITNHNTDILATGVSTQSAPASPSTRQASSPADNDSPLWETDAESWESLRPPTFEEYLAQTAPHLLEPAEEPTSAHIIHEQNLPVFRTNLFHPVLLWALTTGAGIGLGALAWFVLAGNLLVESLSAPGFWLATLGGIATAVLWVRGLWGTSAVIAELYHKFRWDEPKAKREAWTIALGGSLLLLLGILIPGAMLMGWLATRPAPLVPAVLMTIVATLLLPLWLVALVEGFLIGRAHAVQAHIDTLLSQAKQKHKADFSAQRQSAYTQYQQYLQEWRQSLATPTAPEDTQPESGRSANQAPASHSEGRADTDTASLTVNFPDPRLVEDARVKWARCSWAHLQYHRVAREMREEIWRYEQELERLQPRPIYDLVNENQHKYLAHLKCECIIRYNQFVEQVAEAVRPLKDGEELYEQILSYRIGRTN